uniref:Uncharacterized protein n=1 Tax=Cyclopterus lumpus TaxID=8103 RepID=A0A8C2ZE97_CYCLU
MTTKFSSMQKRLRLKIKVPVVWTCTLVVSLLVESCHAQKLNIHWGPQSMMYLKGKHGRRSVSEEDNSVLTRGLQGWYAVLRGTSRPLQLHSLQSSSVTHAGTKPRGLPF